MKTFKLNSDYLGIFSGSLCILHCAFTPILFLSQTPLVTLNQEAPVVWKMLNFLFLILSFIAVYRSGKNSNNTYVKRLLLFTLIVLCICILNELFELFHVLEVFSYLAAASLCALHLYNLKYCSCNDESCCVHNT